MSYIYKQDDVFAFVATMGFNAKTKNHELIFDRCPYCNGGRDDKETFSINLESGAYNCFRATCGAHGHFVQLCRDFDYKLQFDNDGKKHYKTYKSKRVPTPTDYAIDYFKSRCISAKTVERYGVTTDKNNSNVLVFPFYNESGVLTLIKFRKTDFRQGIDKNKEWSDEGGKPILFGMPQCNLSNKTIIITEGQIDSLSVAECGYSNAVSVPTGAKGFTWYEHCREWLNNNFDKLIVFGDYERGKMSLLEELSQKVHIPVYQVRFEDYLGEKDANAILCKYGKDAIVTCIENAVPKEIKHIIKLSSVENVNLNELPKLLSGIKELDEAIGGFYYGQLGVLSGKRGEGKSTFASQLVAEALDQGEKVLVYSGELANYHFKNWLDRQLAGNTFIGKDDSIDPAVLNQINNWYDEKAFLFDNRIIDYEEQIDLIKIIEESLRQRNIKFVLLDNLMTAIDYFDEGSDLYRQQSKFIGHLKRLATQYNAFILLIAHPKKGDGLFNNDSVSGSGDVTNKADIVLNYSRAEEGVNYDSKLIVTKNRLTGQLISESNAITFTFMAKSKRILPYTEFATAKEEKKIYSWAKIDNTPSGWDDIEGVEF